MQATSLTYAERAALCDNPLTAKLFNLMHTKKTNLAVAADVTNKAELLGLVEQIGPEICMLKLHIDLITDFDQDLITRLKALAKKDNFLLIEDRKFADIGAVAQQQYTGGIYKIAQWADLVTVHAICGDDSVKALQQDHKEPRGALLIAQLSSKGNLINDEYTQKVAEIAARNRKFVAGFIAQSGFKDPAFVVCTPGVNLEQTGDNLGQQYNSPSYVVKNKAADVIIVGRGICLAQDPRAAAQTYRAAGWQAYTERCEK